MNHGGEIFPGYAVKELKPHRLALLSIWQDDGFGNPWAALSYDACSAAIDFAYEELDGTFYTPDRRRPRS